MLRTGLLISLSLHAGVFLAGGFLLRGTFQKPIPNPVTYEVELVSENSLISQSSPKETTQQEVQKIVPPPINPVRKTRINKKIKPKPIPLNVSNSSSQNSTEENSVSEKTSNTSSHNSQSSTVGSLEVGLPSSGNPLPRYPESARRKLQEGVVLLDVLVDQSGEVAAVDLSKSSAVKVLDEAAIEAVKKWQFKPAMANERKVTSRVQIPIRFQLK